MLKTQLRAKLLCMLLSPDKIFIRLKDSSEPTFDTSSSCNKSVRLLKDWTVVLICRSLSADTFCGILKSSSELPFDTCVVWWIFWSLQKQFKAYENYFVTKRRTVQSRYLILLLLINRLKDTSEPICLPLSPVKTLLISQFSADFL